MLQNVKKGEEEGLVLVPFIKDKSSLGPQKLASKITKKDSKLNPSRMQQRRLSLHVHHEKRENLMNIQNIRLQNRMLPS